MPETAKKPDADGDEEDDEVAKAVSLSLAVGRPDSLFPDFGLCLAGRSYEEEGCSQEEGREEGRRRGEGVFSFLAYWRMGGAD